MQTMPNEGPFTSPDRVRADRNPVFGDQKDITLTRPRHDGPKELAAPFPGR
jgi:hypothetical protein